jgi:hypothetical protein
VKATDRMSAVSGDHRDTPPEDVFLVSRQVSWLRVVASLYLPGYTPMGRPVVTKRADARRYSCGGSSGIAADRKTKRRTGFPLSFWVLVPRRTVTTICGMRSRFASMGRRRFSRLTPVDSGDGCG